jgi:phosphoribosylanthranilate isomerase
MKMVIKICGMCYPENIMAVSDLKPEILGFIFYPGSTRYAGELLFPEILANLPPDIRKTGVFVDGDFNDITDTVKKYSLNIVQLHGNESPELCRRLQDAGIQLIKAFNIKDRTGFIHCSEFIGCTDYFLFDAATPHYGGSGQKFDWNILDRYDLGHPFILSGGITPTDIDNITGITNNAFYGIDLNSRFEIKPGLKDIEKLKKFITGLRLKQKLL